MDDAQHWFKEGVALYEKGDYRHAITAFDKTIAIDPTMAEVWNNRGLALIQTEQYQEALQSISKSLSINPNYENAKKARKIVLDLLKDPENANNALGPAGSPLPPVPGAPARNRSKIVVATVIVIMLIAVTAGGLMVMKSMQKNTCTTLPAALTPEPTTVPTEVLTTTAVPTTTQPIVPSSGVWVEIIYDQYYSGSVGTPSSQQMVSGSQQMVPNTGDQFYQIPKNDGFITASVSKNDGSGDNLTVNIFAGGTLVKTDSTTVPYGSLDVVALIPTLGSPPAVNSSGNVNLPTSANTTT
ncbi:MAG: tetratricopeptide repeat protein [Methanoregula sp.]|uniref:tetratricopeptide repeat protein n=1 Tax=Methanoregula sp. TaxID=2052170 RepID=UPI003C27775B